ncbi:MAG: response regulator receiver protein [Verrucomicrobiales bacterium]|nr:response regulator receiver protein [Verrucomicrobiales bacterium]
MSKIKRFLLGEDDPRDVELTLAALAEYGPANEVVVVGNGEQVLDYLHRRGELSTRKEGNPVVVLSLTVES